MNKKSNKVHKRLVTQSSEPTPTSKGHSIQEMKLTTLN